MRIQTTFQIVASELAAAFTRDNPRVVWTLKDASLEWMRDALHDAHTDGRLPDDWIYENARSMVDSIAECSEADEVDTCEIADGCVDSYTVPLTAWLAMHLGNVVACDEADEELGGSSGSLVDRIRLGQFLLLDRACAALVAAIEAEADRRDSSGDGADGIDAVST